MKAKSIKGKSIGELKAALAETITADFRPTLAVVFISVKQDREQFVNCCIKKAYKFLVPLLPANLSAVRSVMVVLLSCFSISTRLILK
jgi:hypothetical protein